MEASEKIFLALIESYQKLGISDNSNTIWPNKVLKTLPQGFHTSVSIFPGDFQPMTMGQYGEDGANGMMTILLKYPTNSGAVQSMIDTDLIRGTYRHGTRIEKEGLYINIRSCSPSSGYLDGNFWVVPITITFYTRFRR